MSNSYIVVSDDYSVDTRAYYAQTLEEAIVTRDKQIANDNHRWKIYENVEEVTKSKFWRRLQSWTDAVRLRLQGF